MTLTPCAFFSHASPAALQFAASRMALLHMRRREVLRPLDRPFHGLGVVLQGNLQALDLTLDGREAALMTVPLYETFGHANLLATRPAALTWVASTASTTVAVMPSEPAQELMQFPEMALGAARRLAQEVCELLDSQKIQSVHPVSARVCAWLQQQARQGLELRLPTHAELAWRLNTTRETVTRVLQRLLTDGVLQRDGEVWLVARMDLLRDLARGDER